jgi:hypothetical protein
MIDPVLGGILSEGKASYGISVDLVIELEDDAEASVCKGGMRRLKEDVVK